MKAVLTTAIIIIGVSFFGVLHGQNVNRDSLLTLAEDFLDASQYEQAFIHFEEAGDLFLQNGDSLKWTETKLRGAVSLINAGKVQEALDFLTAFTPVQPAHLPASFSARLNYYKGWAHRLLEQYDASKKYYREGIKFAEASGDSVLIGRLNNNTSYAYLYSGEYDKALSYQMKAKEIFETSGQRARLASVLNGIFLTYSDLGLPKQAEKYIRQSLEIRKEIGNLNSLDVAYHNMALSFKQQGKIDSAIINYQRSLELSRQLENPYDITQTLLNIGDLYKQSSDYENALLYYNEALTFNRETNRPASIADNLSKIAGIAIIQEDYAAAQSFYNEALALLEGTEQIGTIINVNLKLADLMLIKAKYEEAENYILKGLRLAEERNLTPYEIEGHQLLGKLYKANSEFEKSLEEYKISYNLFVETKNTSDIAPIINLAKAYNKVNSEDAFLYAEKAFTRIDSLRTNVAGLTFRAGFFSDYAAFYYEVASWYINQKENSQKAYELVEAAKARVLMDELAEAENKIYQKLDETTLIKKQQLLKQIDRLHGQITTSQNPAAKEALRNELKDLEFQYQTFLNEMRAQIPEWKKFNYPKPLTTPEVMNLLDENTAILEYAFAGNSLICFAITQDEILTTVTDSVKDKSARDYLNDEIRKFRTYITDQKPISEDFEAISEMLYWLLVPVENDLLYTSEISQFVIIPDAALSFLPFEAIRANGRYLIEQYNIKYLPSASIYPLIQPPHRSTNFDLLAVAGSGFESTNNFASPSRSQSNFASLPSTLVEVEAISANFENAKVLKNEDVSEAVLKSYNLGDYRFIHFATHGKIDEAKPSQSGLILSKKTETESLFGEDGYLNSVEISGLHLNTDLVTLSACNTGMGKIITGEGLLGLQRSFLSAGSSSVMVSLWNIFDRSTSEFMATFYNSMLDYREKEYGMWSQTLNWFGMYTHPMFDYKAKALQEAKLAMINHPYYSHPVHWAPFILIGK